MSKTLEKLRTLGHIAFVDDERSEGNAIIVTLHEPWCFKVDPTCGVRGFDTVREAQEGCKLHQVYKPEPAAEHTTAPFEVAEALSTCVVATGKDGKKFIVARVEGDSADVRTKAERQADAAFIAKACSSHDLMVGILKDLAENVTAMEFDTDFNGDDMQQRIVSALAGAK